MGHNLGLPLSVRSNTLNARDERRATQHTLHPIAFPAMYISPARPPTLLISIPHQKMQSTCPLGDIHLLVPAISRWAWHPFTIARATPAAGLTPGALTLHVKGEGQWTRALRRLAAAGAGRRLEVRASLPARSLPAPEPWAAAEAVAVVVGGIAATAAMPALRSLVEARRSGHQGPRRVLVLWAARHATEFLALDPVVGAAAL